MSKIKFIRRYNLYGLEVADIVYHTNRVSTVTTGDMPRTAQEFLRNAKTIVEQYDTLYKRNETLYFAK